MGRNLLATMGAAATLTVLVGFSLAGPWVPREEVARGVLPADEPQVKGEEPGLEKGWEIDLYDNPVKAYDRENLFLYLGDKTDRYTDYGFVRLTHGVYRPGLNDKPAAVVDAYEMETPLGAYGIFSLERNRDDRMIDIGAGAAHLGAKECVFWKGTYFVRVSLTAEVANAEDVLTTFAKRTAQNIAGVVTLPEPGWFPAEKRAAAGDRYVVRELLGYPCLGRGFAVEYDLDGTKATMFLAVIPPGTVVKQGDEVKVLDAQRSYLELRSVLVKEGSVPAVLPGPWESGYRATDPNLGRGLIARSRHYVVGVFGTPDEQTAVEMLSSLVEALR